MSLQSQSSTQEMIKELKEVKSIFSNCEKSDKKSYSRDIQQQAYLDLSMRLQVSLDIEWVVGQFMEHIHSYLLFDGYAYSCEEPKAQINYARQKGHSCTYNLKVETVNLGTLEVYRGRKFAESELVLLENLLTLLVYPLRNSIQYKKASLLAHSDALTGVRNRSTFDESLEREINLSHRHGQEFTILVVDIDHFKNVNDTYGHSTGDEVLKTVSTSIQSCIRTTDMLFRYGGEEFVILLANSDCEKSYVIADRILEAVRDIDLKVKGKQLDLSVSIGLACLKGKDNRHTLFDRADSAMYTAKNEGRDQIGVA